jgi:hypothetical protein
MDNYSVEIEELRDGQVVLIVPSLHLLVFGRTLEDAMSWLGASAGGRPPFRQEGLRVADPTAADTAA